MTGEKIRPGKIAWLLSAALILAGCKAPEPEAAPSPSPSAPPPAVQTAGPVSRPAEFALPYYAGGGFHPITGTNRTNLTLAPLLYEGLFSVDKNFQAQRVLCEQESVTADGLAWVFQLRESWFSDGSPVTAAEVIDSLRAAKNSALYAGRLADLLSVSAGEGGTVIITLSRPNGDLPLLLDIPIVKETWDPARPLGTGPYVLEEQGEQIRLAARAGVPAAFPFIPLREVGSAEDLSYAFETQTVSLVSTDLTGVGSMGWSGRYQITDYPTTTLLYLGCNTTKGACRYPEVRRALGLSIDRENMTDTILSGHAVPSALPVHPASGLSDSTLAGTLARNMERAEWDLAAAGWTRGEEEIFRKGYASLELRLLVNQENSYKGSLADAISASFQTLGCSVSVERLPWEEFEQALKKGDFDLYLGETTLTADFSLEVLVESKGALNYGKYDDSRTDDLLAAFRAARSGQRAGAASALCTRLAETAPILPICFKNGSLLTQWGQVRGLDPLQRNVFHGLENWTAAAF